MRALFTTAPEHSHLAPLAPLEVELQSRGHEVAVACGPKLGRYAAKIGLRTLAAGLDIDPDDFRFPVPVPEEVTAVTYVAWAIRAVFAEVLAPAMAPDLRRIAGEWRPDIIVRDHVEFAAWAVGEAVGVPVAAVTFGALADRSFLSATVQRALDELRTQVGLPPDPSLATLYSGPILVPAPPSYVDPRTEIPPTACFVQPLVHDTSGDEQLPAWVDELGGRPVVYVTLGTIFNTLEVFETLIVALRDEPIDLIVTVGRSLDPARLGPQPPNVRVARYVPQSLLLPHVDVVLCHGGYNTVIGSLKAGRPLVIAPLGADQLFHAKRCEALRVARVVDTRSLDAERVRDAVRAVLQEPSYSEAAGRMATEIAELPDVVAAADLLEAAASPV